MMIRFFRYVIVLILFSLTGNSAKAVLDPPELLCANVLPNGDVELTWIAPPDPNSEFASYEIYEASLASGPFVPLVSIANYNTTTFTHVGAAANASQSYYFINVLSTGPPPNLSVDSDTLSTMFLVVTQSTPLGSAVLGWSPQHIPPIATSSGQHIIWMEFPIGTWSVLDTVPASQLNYNHVISVCDDTLSFRIEMRNTIGCTSFSNAIGDRFEDDTPPSPPEIIAASVDTTTGNTTLKWAASPEGDTQGYIVLEVTQTGSVIRDTVFGQFNNTYTDVVSDPSLGSITLTVASFDTCYSGTPPQPNTSATLTGHGTIFLSGSYDECLSEIALQWTPYDDWDSLLQYELFVEANNGPPVLLSVLSPSQSVYLDTNITPFNDYCYFVKATGTDTCEISFSNRFCVTTDYPGLPDFNYIRTATVMADDHIRIVDRVDLTAKVQRYKLERSENDGAFIPIASKPPGTQQDIIFNDFDVDASSFSYRYRVIATDSCGNDALTSNLGSTIWLRANATLDGVNHLNWNGYEQWFDQVGGYRIYRSIDGQPFTLLVAVPPAQWFFDDDVNSFSEGNGSFCYYVEAVEIGNTFSPDTTALSNVACAVQEDQVFIPNAFIAGGANPEFFAVTSYADLRLLEFIVFNRWGQVIWETDDPDERWNGRVNGEFVPQGVYGYLFAYSDGSGKRIEKAGTVTFINNSE